MAWEGGRGEDRKGCESEELSGSGSYSSHGWSVRKMPIQMAVIEYRSFTRMGCFTKILFTK